LALGELIKCVSGTYKGLPYRVTHLMPGVIGGYGNPRSIQLSVSVDSRLSKSYVSILLRGEDLKPKSFPWRVSVNSVNITREFKPQVLVGLEKVTYALQIFDVSQIIKEPGKYLLKLSTETSKAIEVLSVSLVGVTESQDTEVLVDYYSGVLILKKGEEYVITHPCVGHELGVEMVAEFPSRTSEAALTCGDEALITQLIGVSEISLKKLKTSQECRCSITLRRSDVPKPLVLSDLLIYRPLTPSPQVSFDALLTGSKEILVSVRNEGVSRLDKALIIVLCEGRTLSRNELRNLGPGETAELKLTSPEDLSGREVYVRLVYADTWGQNIKTVKLKT